VLVGWSEAEAANVMIMVKERLFAVDDASNVPELLHVTRDGYGSFLIEAVLFLCFLEKLHEERVVEVHHRHHEPLLVVSLTHLYGQTPFRHSSPEPFFLPLKTLHSLLPTATHHCKNNTERGWSAYNVCESFSKNLKRKQGKSAKGVRV